MEVVSWGRGLLIRHRPAKRTVPGALALVSLLSLGLAVTAWTTRPFARVRQSPDANLVTLSIVGTNDVHGNIFPRNDHGGLAVLGGYIRNLRTAREDEGGAVLLIDAGDTFQGGIESNLIKRRRGGCRCVQRDGLHSSGHRQSRI